MSDYKDLDVWKKAHDLTLRIYKTTNEFPKEELYGLVSQIRRSAASIPTNIAEGRGSLYKNEFIRFLGVARGSACELEYQLILSKDLGFITEEDYNKYQQDIRQILKMLNGLIKSIQERPKRMT